MVYAKRGFVVRVIYLVVAIVCFVIDRLRGSKVRGCITLCYHGVKDEQARKFAWQMQALSGTIVSNPMQMQGDSNIQTCLTFDDSFENLLTNVVPVVTSLNFPVTIFVPTGCLGATPCWLDVSHDDYGRVVMSVEQLQLLTSNTLVTFGSHTVSHPHLSTLAINDVIKELCDSKEILESLTGEVVTQLAFPHGDYDDTVLNAAFEAGYRTFYTLEPIIYSGEKKSVSKTIGRFSMSPEVWQIEFLLTVQGAYRWLLPWRSFTRKLVA